MGEQIILIPLHFPSLLFFPSPFLTAHSNPNVSPESVLWTIAIKDIIDASRIRTFSKFLGSVFQAVANIISFFM